MVRGARKGGDWRTGLDLVGVRGWVCGCQEDGGEEKEGVCELHFGWWVVWISGESEIDVVCGWVLEGREIWVVAFIFSRRRCFEELSTLLEYYILSKSA